MNKVSADVTLIKMLEYQRHFMTLIDHMDAEEAGAGIPASLYFDVVRRLTQQETETEKKRLLAIFHPDNLLANRLLIEYDRDLNVVVFQPFVIEMLRHLDRKRLKSLSSEQLEAIRLDLNNSYDRMCETDLVLGSDTFEEVLEVLFERLSNTVRRISDNVSSLQGQAERLAQVIDNADLSDLDESRNVRQALEEVQRIYSRHVIPTLQFLNEREIIKNGRPALEAVGLIADLCSDAGLHTVSQRVRYAQASIRSYEKDIGVVRKSLERYVRLNAQQRLRYDAIETVFNHLQEQVQDLQDGSYRNNTLQPETSLIPAGKLFDGLKKQVFAARLDWADIDHKAYFEEHLRVALPKLAQQHANVVETSKTDDHKQIQKIEEERRFRGLMKAINSMPAAESAEDVHQHLHQYLSVQFPSYRLLDLLSAVGIVRDRFSSDKGKSRIKVRHGLERIRYGGKVLEYFPFKIESREDHHAE
jgi:hypothetical protein